MGKRFKGYTELGGYSEVYVGDGVVYCVDCANQLDKGEQDSLTPTVLWEGSSHSCEECGTELETEYGDPE